MPLSTVVAEKMERRCLTRPLTYTMTAVIVLP